jgi:hypothetical protein
VLERQDQEPVAFYCVTDRNHFLGLVALINSLRLQGHHEQTYVLDCGLEGWQREVLAQGTDISVVAASLKTHPMLLKTVLPLAHPARTLVVLDVDVIVTGRLDPLIELARDSGKALLFPNDAVDRFEPAWACLGFGAPKRHTYVASGQMILAGESGTRLLHLWASGMERLLSDSALTGAGGSPRENPFFYPDMDVLNALIGPAIAEDSYVLADSRATAFWPFEGLRVVDGTKLRVEAADGSHPLLLHHILDKPWNGLVKPTVYSQLMTRLLCGSDVQLRPPARRVPARLRDGAIGTGGRAYVSSRFELRRKLRGRLGIRSRLARRYPRVLKSRYHYEGPGSGGTRN